MFEIAEVDPRRSALQRGGWRRRDGGDFRWWLGGKLQFQLIQQEAELGFGLGIAGEQQLAAVGGRQVNIDHLHGGELLQHAARRQPGRQRVQAPRTARSSLTTLPTALAPIGLMTVPAAIRRVVPLIETRDHLGRAVTAGDFVFAHPIPIAGRISAPDAHCNNCG